MVQLFALTSSAQTSRCKCGKETMLDNAKGYVILEQKDTSKVNCLYFCACSQKVEANSKAINVTKESVLTNKIKSAKNIFL